MNFTPHRPGTAPNTTPDPLLDRTLAHLAGTEPAPDLNARLLRRLGTQTAAQAARNRPPRWGWVSFSVPTVAAAVLLGLLLPRAPSFHHRPAPSASTSPSSPESASSQPATQPTSHLLADQPARPGQESPISPATHSKLKSLQPVAEQGTQALFTQTPQPRLKSQTPTPADFQALDDLHAPSQPAPPLPLTAQERAILHLLRRDGTVELAQLDPAKQIAENAQEQLARKQFFDPPAPPLLKGETLGN